MAASNKQKLKLLYVYRMLMEETDKKHGLTMTQILGKLADAGISAERKSIYRDLEALRQFGLEIVTYPKSPVEYAVVADKPSLAEITLLLDAIQGSKFLTEAKSKQLTRAVKGLASAPQRAQLEKRVHVEGRIKSQNDSVFHNVDTIHEAMRLKRKVRFMYFKYGADLERHPTREEAYVHTPVKLVFSDGLYYLVTWSDNHESFVTFRVDRMHLLQVSSQAATRNEQIAGYTFEDFEYKSFGMFGGRQEHVTLHCVGDGIGVVVDKFGRENLRLSNACGVSAAEAGETAGAAAGERAGASAELGSCDVHVPVLISPQFHGWLAGLNGIVELVGPARAVEEYKQWLHGLLEG